MQREVEFIDFLSKNYPNCVSGYKSYCHTIERTYGKDMDDVVAIVKDDADALVRYFEKMTTLKGLSNYKRGYRVYKEFYDMLSIPSSWVPSVAACGGDPETAHVKYESSVFPSQRPAGLCQFIEDVYPQVLSFAEYVLGKIQGVPFQPIPVFLSKERPQETYLPDVDELAKKICKECEYFCEGCNGRDPRKCKNCRECDMRGRYGTIREILCANEPITSDIAGRFFAAPQPHIVLYFNHFDTATFWESAANVLAHEYLHYLHYSYAHSATNPYNKPEALCEALADFFCVQYSLHRGDNDIAQRKYNAWQRRQNTTWPYWWALRFLPQPYRRHITDYTEHDWIQKYLWVFKESTDSDRAFRRLKED